jgi:glycerophosphoryl diester phosphodiesterase
MDMESKFGVKSNIMLKKVFFTQTLIIASLLNIFGQSDIHVIQVKMPEDCHRFFQYTGKDIPIVSGHRGGGVKGFPENSIECFEHTLKYTPAFFEIDPRLTKDSVIVLMHDETLDRTTNGTGKVSDYTWNELQRFRLKDIEGNVTDFRIPTLEAAIEWARGKTILNLDRKDVPPAMTVALIKRLKAEAFVILTVHTPEQAMWYHREIPAIGFSAHVLSKTAFAGYDKVGFPWKQALCYVGPYSSEPEVTVLYELIHARGATCMISAAGSYDGLTDAAERRQAYIKVFRDGADVLESDLPIEAGEAVKSLHPSKSKKNRYFSTMFQKSF